MDSNKSFSRRPGAYGWGKRDSGDAPRGSSAGPDAEGERRLSRQAPRQGDVEPSGACRLARLTVVTAMSGRDASRTSREGSRRRRRGPQSAGASSLACGGTRRAPIVARPEPCRRVGGGRAIPREGHHRANVSKMSESPFAAAPAGAGDREPVGAVGRGDRVESGPGIGRHDRRPQRDTALRSMLVFRFAATVSCILLTPKTAGARRASRDSRPGRRRVRWTRRPDHPFAVD